MSFTLNVKLFSGDEFISEHEFADGIVKIGRLASAQSQILLYGLVLVSVCR